MVYQVTDSFDKYEGFYPIHIAAAMVNYHHLNTLLKFGGDAQVITKEQQQTAFHRICANGKATSATSRHSNFNVSLIKLMLDNLKQKQIYQQDPRKIDEFFNKIDVNGKSCFMYAVENGLTNVVNYLLSNFGIEYKLEYIRDIDKEKLTPLNTSIELGLLDCCKIIVNKMMDDLEEGMMQDFFKFDVNERQKAKKELLRQFLLESNIWFQYYRDSKNNNNKQLLLYNSVNAIVDQELIIQKEFFTQMHLKYN